MDFIKSISDLIGNRGSILESFIYSNSLFLISLISLIIFINR